MESAQRKERDAVAALGRSEYGRAIQSFGEAQSDYQTAAREAKRKAEADQRQVDQSRGKMLERREEAAKAAADRFAKDIFDTAEAKKAEADELVSRNIVAALQAYHDAIERYGEASRQAKAAQEMKAAADQGRARMAAEKQRARREAPEFNEALAQERQGNQHYQQAAFKQASESFAAATDLFAKATARPVERQPEPRPAPADEVRSVLASYVRAFETKDVALMQEIRPGLKPDEVRKLQESFEQSKEYRLSLKVDSLDVRGDQAFVKGRREDSLISKSGQSFRNESSFTFRLKRVGTRWVIDAVN